MLVPLLTVVAALAAALAVLAARLWRLRAEAEQAGDRLSGVERRVSHATAASRAALAPPAEAEAAEPRADGADRRPARRGRRVTALPDRP